jgi:hypothetical protein
MNTETHRNWQTTFVSMVIASLGLIAACSAQTNGQDTSGNKVTIDINQAPDENLRPVEGAYGWKLGDKLPDNLVVETNNSSLVYNAPDDANWEGWLELTEDRHIAEIVVSLYNQSTNITEIKAVLKEKYGFRRYSGVSTPDHYTIFYGTPNRQAILEASSIPFLTYSDTELSKIADSQTESRKAAADAAQKKQTEDTLKKDL